MIRKAPSPVPFEGGLECRPEDRAAPALVIEPTTRPFVARFSVVTLLIALLQGYEARGLWHYGTGGVATPGFIFVGS
jgi:hypothetical protein